MKQVVASVAVLTLLAVGQALALRQAPDRAALIAKAEKIVDQLAAADFAGPVEQFNATMKAALPAEKLRAAWTAVVAQAGAFKSRVSTDGQSRGVQLVTRVTCRFERQDLDVQIIFDSSGSVTGLWITPVAAPWRPPAYAKPGTYTESEVTAGADLWPLPGTLTVPTGDGPFPAVVLVHGSGPHDRDESIGPNKPFKDLAVGLASRGIAVLRFEKRTQQYAGKLVGIPTFTVKEESIDDAVAAVAKVRAMPKIDAARVFVLGHSLGGTILPRIGAADPKIAGLISLAGATGQLEETMVRQVMYIVSSAGQITPEGQKQIDDTRTVAETVRNLTPADASNPKSIGGAPAAYWLDLRSHDPVAEAKVLTQPMLILQGERDYQVTMEDFARWKTGLESRTNVAFRSYPALNHLFIAGTGKSLPAEYSVAGHVEAAVIDDIAAWVASAK